MTNTIKKNHVIFRWALFTFILSFTVYFKTTRSKFKIDIFKDCFIYSIPTWSHNYYELKKKTLTIPYLWLYHGNGKTMKFLHYLGSSSIVAAARPCESPFCLRFHFSVLKALFWQKSKQLKVWMLTSCNASLLFNLARDNCLVQQRPWTCFLSANHPDRGTPKYIFNF